MHNIMEDNKDYNKVLACCLTFQHHTMLCRFVVAIFIKENTF